MKEIIQNIDNAILRYDELELGGNLNDLSEILRDLTSNLYFLEGYRFEAYTNWLNVYFDTQGSNAHREQVANLKEPNLYMLRRKITSAYKIVDSIRSQIGIYKKEA